jgi:Rieske Fe-S protein
VAAVGAAGLAAALTACGSDDGSTSVSSDGSGGAGAAGGSAGTEVEGTVLARTTDIPEGGGKIFKDQGVVVTQPAAGTFKAFSAKCTHAGCAVADIVDGAIICPCHNSAFSVSDGSVRKGPAPRPLPAERITVEGDAILLD